MFKDLERILFATNFSKNCKPAFDLSLSLARRYHAILVLLHVIESDLPITVESEIRTNIGEDKWEELQKKYKQDARQTLIGKMTPESIAKTAFQQYCSEMENDKNKFLSTQYQTIVSKGDVANMILDEAENHNCDIIVMGAKKGFLKNNSLGLNIKQVMRKSKVPVVFVPPRFDSQ